MEPSLILSPLRYTGGLWQGGWSDENVRAIPGPLWIVNLADDPEKRDDSHFADGKQIVGCLYRGIPDSRDGVLSDGDYFNLLRLLRALLYDGNNLYIHCWSGWSRSSYLTMGILMSEFRLGYDEALAFLKSKRPQAQPNCFFEAHLRTMESRLRQMREIV